VHGWKQRWAGSRGPHLRAVTSWRSVSIHDGRGKVARGYRFDDRGGRALRVLPDARTRGQLRAAVDGDDEWLDRILAELVDRD
jgi:hypothetical protein